jgi:hypothetical protein
VQFICDKGASLFDYLHLEWSCHREVLAIGSREL